MRKPLLTVAGLTKAFPGILALDDVSLDVASGEILAVVGQNGSGKSTLVKVLAGVYTADAGLVRLAKAEHAEESPGIRLHFIHQDLGLISRLSTVENLDLTRNLRHGGLRPFRRRREAAYASRLIARFGASFDVELPIGELSAAERTIVAIARALDGWIRPDEVLVLDEPTAALHGSEVERLFSAVKRVAQQGGGVIFISHRLDEVLGLADRVVALRDGRVVADVSVGQLDHDKLVQVIVGREIRPHEVNAPGPRSRHVVLAAQGLTGGAVRGVDVALREGEIVGLSGSLGSGREHIARLLFGAERRATGEVKVVGQPLPADDPRAAIRQQVAYVSEDRQVDGAVMDMSVRENLTLPMLAPLVGRFGQLRTRSEREQSQDWANRVELNPRDPERKLSLFSGGNQQKVVLAKWLRTTPKVLLLDEPTQGVDVGAKAAIYKLIAGAAEKGTAVMVSSSDTRELVTICDRVLVLRDGLVVAELSGERLTEEDLIRHSLGLEDAQAGTEGPARV